MIQTILTPLSARFPAFVLSPDQAYSASGPRFMPLGEKADSRRPALAKSARAVLHLSRENGGRTPTKTQYQIYRATHPELNLIPENRMSLLVDYVGFIPNGTPHGAILNPWVTELPDAWDIDDYSDETILHPEEVTKPVLPDLSRARRAHHFDHFFAEQRVQAWHRWTESNKGLNVWDWCRKFWADIQDPDRSPLGSLFSMPQLREYLALNTPEAPKENWNGETWTDRLCLIIGGAWMDATSPTLLDYLVTFGSLGHAYNQSGFAFGDESLLLSLRNYLPHLWYHHTQKSIPTVPDLRTWGISPHLFVSFQSMELAQAQNRLYNVVPGAGVPASDLNVNPFEDGDGPASLSSLQVFRQSVSPLFSFDPAHHREEVVFAGTFPEIPASDRHFSPEYMDFAKRVMSAQGTGYYFAINGDTLKITVNHEDRKKDTAPPTPTSTRRAARPLEEQIAEADFTFGGFGSYTMVALLNARFELMGVETFNRNLMHQILGAFLRSRNREPEFQDNPLSAHDIQLLERNPVILEGPKTGYSAILRINKDLPGLNPAQVIQNMRSTEAFRTLFLGYIAHRYGWTTPPSHP